jgi:hypothetical protein
VGSGSAGSSCSAATTDDFENAWASSLGWSTPPDVDASFKTTPADGDAFFFRDAEEDLIAEGYGAIKQGNKPMRAEWKRGLERFGRSKGDGAGVAIWGRRFSQFAPGFRAKPGQSLARLDLLVQDSGLKSVISGDKPSRKGDQSS